LLVLSARTELALHALAAAVSTHLFRADPAHLSSLCLTLGAGRVPMPWRLAVVGDSTADLARKVSLAVDAIARPQRPAGPLEVVIGPGADTSADLARQVAEIAADLPSLDVPEVSPQDDPVRWLTGALGQLGVAARVRTDPAATELAAFVYGDERIPAVSSTTAFLDALAALYRAGADLRLAPLRAPGARLLPDLPTYPFQRKRFWIDEPVGQAAAPQSAVDPTSETSSEPSADASGADVAAFLLGELVSVLRADGDPDLRLTFAELGGDSFTAMLFAKSVEDRYGVEDLAAGFAVDQPLADLLDLLAELVERSSR
jgi:acyl transferase domain-containing protein